MSYTAAKQLLTLAVAACFLLLTGCAEPPRTVEQEPAPDVTTPVELEPIHVTNITPAPVSEADLHPGLDALYYVKYFKRNVTGLPEGKSSQYPSFRRKPILELNHSFGKENVFDSNTNRGVGIRMTGYLHLEKTGVYELQALSNDGILLYLDDQLVLRDPKQHSDRLSNLGIVTVTQSGWYPLKVEYFQRKGTATLKLLWKTPGKGSLTPVPAAAYRHTP